ncbi:2-amino-4-hydroxy-6-hydroxymethyldihydropteridine diphosphokinase [Xylanibacter caecicola]|uniref:2-amino-4-hydroxy-6- hydroxymethyldihydropteridine diphosphokinase n=1 Tax=Xylanibacter caecicola TaxID=2736294 RepID=UPI002583B7B0|nr:2-amino-4-hydroxy-6-hydroxymethyldihydropteridine diphosphokinase [Xylanibacter caecicola]
MNNIIISLGSNTDQARNIMLAVKMIGEMFPFAEFTEALWTEPVGLKSEKFLNCLCHIKSFDDMAAVESNLKYIERCIGRTAENSMKGIIAIDIDILKFNDTKLHTGDWQRDYIQKLIKNISF